MPRFYFDVDDGERYVRDDAGIDLASVTDVERATRLLLFDLAHGDIAKLRPKSFVTLVRNERGRPVYRGFIRLDIERCER